MKDPDYNITMISKLSDLIVTAVQKEELIVANGEEVKLNYPLIFSDNCIYRGSLDNINAIIRKN